MCLAWVSAKVCSSFLLILSHSLDLDPILSHANQPTIRLGALFPHPWHSMSVPKSLLEDIDAGLSQQALGKLKTSSRRPEDVPLQERLITNSGAQAQVSTPINQAITLLQGM